MTLYTARGRCVSIHDGDTATFDLDLGWGVRIPGQDWDGRNVLTCRVFGINAPELRTPDGDAALAYIQTILQIGDICTVTSHSWDRNGGRYDADVLLSDGSDLATKMVESGHAIRKNYTDSR